MGTRHLISVKIDGEPKIAQYGQWDGYPSGQGMTVLNFLRRYNRAKFENRLIHTRFTTPKDEADIDSFLELIDSKDGWMNQEERFNKEYPYFSRDIGGKILQMVHDSEGEVLLRNNMDFLTDGVFCEWAYIIDLDSNQLEVYSDGGTKIKSYNLTELPTDEQFLADLKPKEEE